MFELKNIELANLGMAWFVCGIVKNLLALYQSNEPGFGARLFIIVALVVVAILVCKLLLPWIAGITVNHIAGVWIHTIGPVKGLLGRAVMQGCTWVCSRVCRPGRGRPK